MNALTENLTAASPWAWATGFVKDEVTPEEWQQIVIDAAVLTPIRLSPCPVIFFRFVNNSKFIQLVGEGLIGINMVLVQIAARPVNLEPLQRFQVVGILRDHRLQEKVVA